MTIYKDDYDYFTWSSSWNSEEYAPQLHINITKTHTHRHTNSKPQWIILHKQTYERIRRGKRGRGFV